MCVLCREIGTHTSDASTPARRVPALADTDVTPCTFHLLPSERRNIYPTGRPSNKEVVILHKIGLNLLRADLQVVIAHILLRPLQPQLQCQSQLQQQHKHQRQPAASLAGPSPNRLSERGRARRLVGQMTRGAAKSA